MQLVAVLELERVALGRAIVREPKAFFMDEPLGALDAEFRERMAEELRALHDRMGATTELSYRGRRSDPWGAMFGIIQSGSPDGQPPR